MENMDLAWWIQVVEVPLIGGFFLWIRNQISAVEHLVERLRENYAFHVDAIRKDLADYKLDVARNYASMSAMKDLETRLTDHLLRIEKKLERGDNL